MKLVLVFAAVTIGIPAQSFFDDNGTSNVDNEVLEGASALFALRNNPINSIRDNKLPPNGALPSGQLTDNAMSVLDENYAQGVK